MLHHSGSEWQLRNLQILREKLNWNVCCVSQKSPLKEKKKNIFLRILPLNRCFEKQDII